MAPTLSPQVTPYYGGGQVTDPANVIKTTGAPSSANIYNKLGTIAVDNAAATAYMLVSKSGGVATWIDLGGGSGSFTSLTATTGNITATLGNVVLSGVGSGFVTTPTVVAAGASPQTANGRIGQVTFSGVSIASGASQTFTITNSAVTGASTVVDVSWYGATAGSGLSIASITNSAGSTAIVMTNSTSATNVTSTANITFVYQVLN
jgi:hypothetical protein